MLLIISDCFSLEKRYYDCNARKNIGFSFVAWTFFCNFADGINKNIFL